MVTRARPLVVDGDRPAVEWVTSLPQGWTTPKERIVLLLLAMDTYDRKPPFRSKVSRDQLAVWSGELGGRISEAITSLERPTSARPALLLVERNRGRGGNVYELLTPPEWSGTPDDYAIENGPAHRTISEREWSGTPDDSEWSGPPDDSGRNGPINRPENGPAHRTTPFPIPTTPPPAYLPEDARANAAAEPEDVEHVRRKIRSRAGVDLEPEHLAELASLLRAGWTPTDLANALTDNLGTATNRTAVVRARLHRIGPPLATSRPPWCGECDQHTRLRELDDGRPVRCPRCHPRATRSEAATG